MCAFGVGHVRGKLVDPTERKEEELTQNFSRIPAIRNKISGSGQSHRNLQIQHQDLGKTIVL